MEIGQIRKTCQPVLDVCFAWRQHICQRKPVTCGVWNTGVYQAGSASVQCFWSFTHWRQKVRTSQLLFLKSVSVQFYAKLDLKRTVFDHYSLVSKLRVIISSVSFYFSIQLLVCEFCLFLFDTWIKGLQTFPTSRGIRKLPVLLLTRTGQSWGCHKCMCTV